MNLIVAGLKRDWLPIAIILLFVAGTHLIRLHYELTGISYNSFLTNAILVSSGLFVSGVLGLGRMLGVDRPVRPFAYLNTNPEVQAVMRNLVQSLLLILPVCLFLPSFGLLKSLVGFLQPYEWDSVFIQWNLMIHGQDAWRVIQPLIGYPKVTFCFAMAYQMWILLLLTCPIRVVHGFRYQAIFAQLPPVAIRMLLALKDILSSTTNRQTVAPQLFLRTGDSMLFLSSGGFKNHDMVESSRHKSAHA